MNSLNLFSQIRLQQHTVAEMRQHHATISRSLSGFRAQIDDKNLHILQAMGIQHTQPMAMHANRFDVCRAEHMYIAFRCRIAAVDHVTSANATRNAPGSLDGPNDVTNGKCATSGTSLDVLTGLTAGRRVSALSPVNLSRTSPNQSTPRGAACSHPGPQPGAKTCGVLEGWGGGG